jgi:hypothetical protein
MGMSCRITIPGSRMASKSLFEAVSMLVSNVQEAKEKRYNEMETKIIIIDLTGMSFPRPDFKTFNIMQLFGFSIRTTLPYK